MNLLFRLQAIVFCIGLIIISNACQTSSEYQPPGTSKNNPALKNLSKVQYEVTQKGATEKAFKNPFWNHYEPGIYVDVVSGDALFSSLDKFDSKSGFPAFKAPISSEAVKLINEPYMFLMSRIELRSKASNSHLGHLFMNGPGKDKKHYCVNSASLRFIPVGDLEKSGYGKYKTLFSKKSE